MQIKNAVNKSDQEKIGTIYGMIRTGRIHMNEMLKLTGVRLLSDRSYELPY